MSSPNYGRMHFNQYAHCDMLMYRYHMWQLIIQRHLNLFRFYEFSYIIEDYSCLKCCISTKISQIMCLINTHSLMFRYIKFYCKLWYASWSYCIFWAFHALTCELGYVVTRLQKPTKAYLISLCFFFTLYNIEDN